MNTDNFFKETSAQSEVKIRIVTKYFAAWSNVILPSVKTHSKRIAYIDLFAGPGKYEDGTKSTPLRILEYAISKPDLRNMLISRFSDEDRKHVESLRKNIASLEGIKTLKYSPEVIHEKVDTEVPKMFGEIHLIPTLLFADPWGYKGLSLDLIKSVIKDWACECIFFFNYNRINMGLTNQSVQKHIDDLFGEERAKRLRKEVIELSPIDREGRIIYEHKEALKEALGKFVLPFCFKTVDGSRTSHYVIFVSKDFKGYEIMKEIMAKESSFSEQGVPSFEYNPIETYTPRLFYRPLDMLEESLLKTFAGERLTIRNIFERHSVGQPYIMKNYKEVLRNMETSHKIQADPPADKRRKRKGKLTMADTVEIIFPKKKNK